MEHYRDDSGRVVGSSDCCDLPDLLPDFESVPCVLLLASITDHRQSRHRHVAVLFGVFVHPVLFHLGFCVFLHRMFFVMRDCPGHGNGMPDVVVEFDTVTFDLPGGTILGGQIVLIGVFTFLQTPRERPGFLVGCYTLRYFAQNGDQKSVHFCSAWMRRRRTSETCGSANVSEMEQFSTWRRV